MQIHTIEHNQPVFLLEDINELKGLSFSDNGYHMMTFSNLEIKVWDLRKSSVLISKEFENSINKASYDFSGGLICIALDNNISLLNVKDGSVNFCDLNQNFNNYSPMDFKIFSKNEAMVLTKNGILIKKEN